MIPPLQDEPVQISCSQNSPVETGLGTTDIPDARPADAGRVVSDNSATAVKDRIARVVLVFMLFLPSQLRVAQQKLVVLDLRESLIPPRGRGPIVRIGSAS